MKLGLRLLVTIFVLAAGSIAHADTITFAFSGNFQYGGAVSGYMTAVADPSLADTFDITGITGSVGIGGTITSLLPCTTYDLSNPCTSNGNSFSYSNLLYYEDGIPRLDVGFALGTGGLEGAIVPYGSHTFALVLNAPHDQLDPGGLSVTQVPEPDAFILLGTGLLGAADIVRRRLRG